MALKTRRVKNEFEADVILKGGIWFPVSYRGNERLYGLHGLTLTFTTPSVIVTFADASSAGLLIKQIMAEIDTDSSHALKAFLRDGVLYVVDSDYSGAVVLNRTTSTAKGVFKMKDGNLSGTLYAAPGGAPPALISLADSGVMDGFTLVTAEA